MRKLGRVIEVYLPTEEELTKIGFKIQIENEIINIIEEQNLDNAKIYRDDFVFIDINNENNQISYSIESITDKDLGDDEDE